MVTPLWKVFPPPSPMTWFFSANVVQMLIRSKDWYELKPIERYILNMGASVIRMEDAITETREYKCKRFLKVCRLCEQSRHSPGVAANIAYMLWCHDEKEFGVIHLEDDANSTHKLIAGDDPCDVDLWWDRNEMREFMPHLFSDSQPLEGQGT